MSTSDYPNDTHRRLSLKWKLGLVVFVLLMVVNLALTHFNRNVLLQQFEQDLIKSDFSNRLQMSALMSREQEDLLKLGAVASSMFNEQDVTDSGTLQQLWQNLQFEWGIERMDYLDTDGNMRFAAGNRYRPLHMDTWLEKARREEQAKTFVDCREYCRLYALIPVLGDGAINGFLMLSHSLTDLVITLSKTSHAATGIMTSSLSADHQAARLIPIWGVTVTALTMPETNLPILKTFSEHLTLAEIQDSKQSLHIDDRHYRLQLMSIEEQGSNGPTYFVFLHDITTQSNAIREQSRLNLTTGISALVILLLLMMLILRSPMRRLQHIVDSLPLLASHDFIGFRRRITAASSPRVTPDEIDELNYSMVTLANELQYLQSDIEKHANDLEHRTDELTKERDFITSLLDSAQVIIVSSDRAGVIRLLNTYGEKLSGYLEQELIGKHFHDFFLPTEEMVSVHHALDDIRAGNRNSYHHESGFFHRDGEESQVSWLHTRLHPNTRATHEPVMISVGIDISDRLEAEQRLAWLADHDPLTSLFNRRRFQSEFKTSLDIAHRYQRSGALLYLDLDEFKLINDTRGHQAGDELLQSISESLRSIVRSSDIVSRLGGDEFAVVMRETDVDGAIQTAEKIIEAMSGIEIQDLTGNHSISTSIGIVQFPEHGKDINELLANADLAMYQAKEDGKSRWHLFQSEDKSRERVQRQAFWKERIESALREEQFLLYYQPIMNIRSEEISHYEILLRMQDNDGGIIPPGAFIGVAEHIGLIHAIDHWVIRKALETQANLGKGQESISFSINLSGRVINDRNLLPLLREHLRQPGIDPACVVFELTETSAVADIASAQQLMHEIRDLGCQFALDDFGVGFSSFAYLKQLPMDFVKIDGSFIRNLPANLDDQLFVKALTDVARGMGKKTIAEFVEDGETLNMLAQYGVDYAQGYYIGKPAPELHPVAD